MATEKAAPAAIEDDEIKSFAAEDPNEPKPEAKDVVLDAPKGDPEPEPVPVDPGMAELKRQLETREAELRDRNAQIEAERNQRIQAERQSGVISVAMVDQAMEAAKGYRGQLRSQYIAAQTAGNYEATADIQIAMSQNEANLLALQQQRQQVEAYNAQPQPQRQAPQHQDMASQMIAQVEQAGSYKSAQWLRDHRDQASSERGLARIRAAHSDAVEFGQLVPETPEYFAYIENKLGLRQAEPQAEPESKPVRVVRAPAAAAPVSSRTPSLSGRDTGPRTIRLNADQVEAAGYLGMSLEEYAASIDDPAVKKRLIGNR